MAKKTKEADKAVETPVEKVVEAPAPVEDDKVKILYVESRVREYLKGLGVQVGADCLDKLDEAMRNMIETAVARTKANDRKTLRAIDF